MTQAYIGKSKNSNKKITYDLNQLTKHAAVVGTTGSGKTVMCKVIVEEALASGIPVIAIDPKGDIGSLAVTNANFDFRPYGAMASGAAQKVAEKYHAEHKSQDIPSDKIKKLQKVQTKIYTPKSSVGQSISLMPKLTIPIHFDSDDINSVAALVDPVAASLVSLAEMSGKSADRTESLLSAIISHEWSAKRAITLPKLIELIVKPPFQEIGSMPLNDVMPEKERKKIAAQLNLLLSSPTKKVWAAGEDLDVPQMFTENQLSVFDLRYVPDQNEKQFVVEVLLQEIYKFLLSKGGSEELKYILYIDELAGFIPAPPANPSTKRQLELLIRQARAFGLGIIVATQNPGDIDYKIFGNIGSRFVGKLRTQLDMEKVAAGMELDPSTLREQMSSLQTGDFVYNNAIKNNTQQIHARWLYSFHGGPLSTQEIGWINTPKSVPAQDIKLKIDKKAKTQTKENTESHLVSAEQVLAQTQGNELSGEPLLNKGAVSVIGNIIAQVKERADVTQLKIAISDAKQFTPHIRITIEPKEVDGMKMPTQGPYVFDLTSKLIPIDNYLKEMQFRTFMESDVSVEKPSISVSETIKYALNDAKHKLKTPYYYSKPIKNSSKRREELVDLTLAHLKEKEARAYHKIEDSISRQIEQLKYKIDQKESERSELTRRMFGAKTSRFVKRLFGNKKIASKTTEMSRWSMKKEQLSKEIERMESKSREIERKGQAQKAILDSKLQRKVQSMVTQEYYVPKGDDLKLTATILLVPKRSNSL